MKLGYTLLMAGLALPFSAHAEDFPNRPIRIIVGFAAGGSSDIATRLTAQALSKELGQPVVVDNQPGASGAIGAAFVARAPADGYTLFACSISTHGSGPALVKKASYDPEADFTPIGMIVSTPNVLVVHPSVPVQNLREFVEWAKKGRGSLNYGSPGIGSSAHMSMELLKQMAGIDMIAVPHKGSGPLQQALLGNHVPAMFDGLAQNLPAISAGRSRAIAVTSLQRNRSLPDLPTLHESGLPGYQALSWQGLCAPSGVPEAIAKKLVATLDKTVKDPDLIKKFEDGGWDLMPMSRPEFTAFIKAELTKWRQVALNNKMELQD